MTVKNGKKEIDVVQVVSMDEVEIMLVGRVVRFTIPVPLGMLENKSSKSGK